MLLNLSHHPSGGWDDAQRRAARDQFGPVEDRAFPSIDPAAAAGAVAAQADDYAARCREALADAGSDTAEGEAGAVHVMGEMTFTAALVARLQQAGVRCVASTTERRVAEQPDGSRNVTFRFVQFRDYPPPP